MAMVAFLVAGEANAGDIKPAVADQLARLGVTNVAVLRDREGICVVIDGWAFDAVRSTVAAARALGADPATSRTLHPIIQSALRPWNEET